MTEVGDVQMPLKISSHRVSRATRMLAAGMVLGACAHRLEGNAQASERQNLRIRARPGDLACLSSGTRAAGDMAPDELAYLCDRERFVRARVRKCGR